MRTRVLYLIENERYGGGERAFAQLARGLNKGEFEVFVACLTGTPGAARFLAEIEGAAVVERLDMRWLRWPAPPKELKKLLLRHAIRVLHSQGPRADLCARLAARDLPGLKVVSTVASPVEEYDVSGLRKTVYRYLDKYRLDRTDRFIAVADHIRAKLERKGVPKEKITRIYNGVKLPLYSLDSAAAGAALARYGIGSGTFVAGAFSRLSAEKGLFTLIEAAKYMALRRAVPDGAVKFLIAGEGPLEGALRSAAASAGLENSFIFTGFLPDPRALMSACGAFVLPSSREGFPLGLLEAMALARPVAVSSIDGVNELIADGVNGLRFPAGDAISLARCLTALYKDRSLAARLGLKAAADIRLGFGIDRMINAHEGLYMEPLKQ